MGEIVEIPFGITRISPMLLDHNLRSQYKGSEDCEEFPLYRYCEIEKLIIPESVDIPHETWYSPFASFGQRPFVSLRDTDCKKIQIAQIENHSSYLSIEDGVLYSADKRRLIYCFGEKTSFKVPSSVRIIEPFAFCLQRSLKEIFLHDEMVWIGPAAFMGCESLEEIVIPPKIIQIPNDCFDGCVSLKNVALPEGLETIGNNAFRNCSALTGIQLPHTLKSLRSFEGCTALKEIEIPTGVESIGGFIFCHSLRKVILNKGVRQIAAYAFRYCDNLREINFPEGLESIGARAFYPSSLSVLRFPGTLREIGSEAFYYNSHLVMVRFRSKDVNIGEAAFACCPLLLKKSVLRPKGMIIEQKVFDQNKSLDKFGFWD